MTKLFAALGILVGGIGAVFDLLIASGVDVSQPLQNAIGRVAALGLLALGVWFHPSVPLGVTKAATKTVATLLLVLAIVAVVVLVF